MKSKRITFVTPNRRHVKRSLVLRKCAVLEVAAPVVVVADDDDENVPDLKLDEH